MCEGGQNHERIIMLRSFLILVIGTFVFIKCFSKITSDINDRPIRTLFEKKYKLAGAVMAENKRGEHGNQPKTNEAVKNIVRDHIKRIPKM